jgi:FkbM family methyltransferase
VEIGERSVIDLMINFVDPGDVIYDIGASIGIYSVLLAMALGDRGKVIAFEPEKQSYLHLLDNLNLNGLTNVQCIQKALGEESGEGRLYVRDGVSCPSLMAPPQNGKASHVTCERVKVEKGDRLVAEENLPLPRAVKIDVEGHEHAVIQGLCHTLAQPACKLVCCEIHPHLLPVSDPAKSIRELLQSLGFARIERQGRARDENFFFIACKEDVTTG